jgi:hypothetical protein
VFSHVDVRHPDDLARDRWIDAMVECSPEPSVMTGREDWEFVVQTATSRVYSFAAQEHLAVREATRASSSSTSSR